MTLRSFLLLAFLITPSVGSAAVVINEIFYNSPADLDRLEFIELHNPGTNTVDLSGWEFTKGIDHEFAEGAEIAAGEFYVLCADAALFELLYGQKANAVFTKGLDNGGETITLKDAEGNKVDSVKYDDKAPWPKSADGYSASLERICPMAEIDDASNWAPSVLSGDYDTKPSGSPGKQNSTYAKTLPPVIEDVTFSPEFAKPNESVTVTAKIGDASLADVQLWYRIAEPGKESEEISVLMKPGKASTYTATVPGAEENRILRFRVKATNKDGDARFYPHQHAIRPALSVYVSSGVETGAIPVGQFFNVGEAEFQTGASYRTSHAQSRGRGFGRGGFGGRREREPSPEERMRRSVQERLSDDALEKAWAEATLTQSVSQEHLFPAAQAFAKANQSLRNLREAAARAGEIQDFVDGLEDALTVLRETLVGETATYLNDSQRERLAAIGREEERQDRGRRFGGPAEMLPRVFNVEESWFRSAMIEGVSGEQLSKLAEVHRAALKDRGELVLGEDIDFRELFEDARALQGNLRDAIGKVLERDQVEGAFGRDRGGRDRRRGPGGRGSNEGPPLYPQGRSAFIYTDPKTKTPQLFDFVNITQRKSGYKVRLHKDRPLNGMTTINVLYESNEGTTLNEVLAYDVYRQAGNATVQAGFMRVLVDGQVAGYHLWFEQPNGSFFRRNAINDKGNLYKLIWMGSHRPTKYTPEDKIPERMDIVGRHEKKTHPHDGYEDIVSLVKTLEEAAGDDDKMWQIIQEHFEVDQVINYFAANALLSHWDGFFNNYLLYHDVKGTGKWSLFPWDQDSTWSLRMGNVEELSTMPINYGAEGARPPGAEARQDDDRGGRRRGRGFGGGRGAPVWWRDGGDISRPLLANPQFYQRFQARLKTLAETVFTKEVFGPKIDAVATSIEPEVRLRAETFDRDPEAAARDFQTIMAQLHKHLELRTGFILGELNSN